MFEFLRKKKKKEKELHSLKAPVTGRVIPISEVPDPVFAEGLLGEGIGIWPEKGVVLAPADGVVTVAPEDSRHACGLCLSNGMELLLHVGLDTIGLNGNGLELKVKAGQSVKTGDELISFDSITLKEAGCQDVVMLVVTKKSDSLSIQFQTGIHAEAGENDVAILHLTE